MVCFEVGNVLGKFVHNVPRLGEGPAFETRQPKPKLNL